MIPRQVSRDLSGQILSNDRTGTAECKTDFFPHSTVGGKIVAAGVAILGIVFWTLVILHSTVSHRINSGPVT